MYHIYIHTQTEVICKIYTNRHSENICMIYIQGQTEDICKIYIHKHSENICMLYIQGQRLYVRLTHTV